MSAPRYIIGIDLGTTNSAVGYIDLADASPSRIEIKSLEILQLVSEDLTGTRLTLPSFLFIVNEVESSKRVFSLPWDEAPGHVCGELARNMGRTAPGQVVSSAKSWLCHGGVERHSRILPWGVESPGGEKVSPIEASSAYLYHMRMAWNNSMDAPMEEQELILTVPASFDEVARELTLEAARLAGLENVTLLEEPLAAFYSWVAGNEDSIAELLGDQDYILVFDVGGGTTDFTLIRCLKQGVHVQLERVAVGDHLLLGGDNMDLALAARAEKLLGKELSTMEWHSLLNQVSSIKERLLQEDGPESEAIRMAGRGRGMVAGTITCELRREEVLKEITEGFFPHVPYDSPIGEQKSAGLREMGLPYESDPAITRHLLRFIRVQGQGVLPSLVLFNGGALKPFAVRHRILQVLSSWAGKEVGALLSPSLDLAISRGAAYYGLTRHGLGLRVGGGIPRSYYIGAGDAAHGEDKAVCIVERGTEEGVEVEVPGSFMAVTNKPVSFKLYSSTTRRGDRVGDVVDVTDLHPLPPLMTVMKYGKKKEFNQIPVVVRAVMTAIGTLELFCCSCNTAHRWRLQFDLRGRAKASGSHTPEGVRVRTQAGRAQNHSMTPEDRRALQAARPLIERFFKEASKGKPLMADLQEVLGMAKDIWSVPVLRALADAVIQYEPLRSGTPYREAQWFNVLGYVLRPGTGDELDPWRMKSCWPLWFKGLFFPSETANRLQWWIFWRRIAAGLGPGQQEQIFGQVSKAVLPKGKRKKRPDVKLNNEERREIFLLMGALEKVGPGKKATLARFVLDELKKKRVISVRDPQSKALVWLLGKLGARHLFFGPLDRVVPPEEVSRWLKELRTRDVEPSRPLFLAVMAMARFTGDRARDLTRAEREEVRMWLETLGAKQEDVITPVMEMVPLEQEDKSYSFGEALPNGLIFLGDRG